MSHCIVAIASHSHFAQWVRLSVRARARDDPREGIAGGKSALSPLAHPPTHPDAFRVATRKFAVPRPWGGGSEMGPPPPQLFRVSHDVMFFTSVGWVDLHSPLRRYPLSCLIGFSNYSLSVCFVSPESTFPFPTFRSWREMRCEAQVGRSPHRGRSVT